MTYAGNTAPDVAMMDPGTFMALAKRKALLPLNEFFDSTPGFDIGAFYKPIVDAHSLNGVCYVLPRDIAPQGLVYYNKKLFREKGIPFPDGSWTWDFEVRPELREKDFLWVMRAIDRERPRRQSQTLRLYFGLARRGHRHVHVQLWLGLRRRLLPSHQDLLQPSRHV